MSRRALLLLLALAVAGAAIAVVVGGNRRLSVRAGDAKADEARGASPEVGPAAPPPAPWTAAEGSLAAHVEARARRLAAEPWRAPPPVPEALRALGYDQYRLIRFREERALWRGEGAFEVQLFHPGSLHDDVIRVWVVEGDSARALAWDPERFAVDPGLALPAGTRDELPGYAGLRVLHPLNAPGEMDEVVAFLDASYFRLLGRGQAYGLSARGIAVDPASERDEEFPAFTEFWLERPGAGQDTLVLHALLDGPSLAGAYHFVLRPGDPSVLDVDVRLFGRRDVGKLGVAPMSSMFFRAPGRGARDADDFRPRVHDSEGLLVWTRFGEWIWRPLENRSGIQTTQLRDTDPRGFGLVQRQRAFDDYLDLEARYDRRPSYWIEAVDGDWGTGGVELLEIPARTEFEDNIAAYWVPDGGLPAGASRSYRYRLRTFGDTLPEQTLGRVERTLLASAALPGTDAPDRPRLRRFVVDFGGGVLARHPSEAPVQARLSLSRGEAAELVVQPLPEDGGRRVTFVVRPEGNEPSDMRLILESDGTILSETWSYVWVPDDR